MNELIPVSQTEARIRHTLWSIINRAQTILFNLKQKIKGKAIALFPFRKEYYIDCATNKIYVRWEPKSKRVMGTWVQIQGKLVKVQDTVYKLPMMIYGWKETDNGMWDDTFQTYVKDKNHYRELLREHGCRQKETYKYSKSAKSAFKDRVKDSRKDLEKAFVKTLNELPVSIKEQI